MTKPCVAPGVGTIEHDDLISLIQYNIPGMGRGPNRYGIHMFELSANVTRTAVSYPNRYGIRSAPDLYAAKDLDEVQRDK